MKTNSCLLMLIISLLGLDLQGQSGVKADTLFSDANFSGLQLRSVGPAFASGRIADIAIHPEDDNVWYVAVGSGGVWKTSNAGVSWTPIFDEQSSYSIGCITIDPNNPHTIWVGTGENVGGRHVGYGDGVYLSEDGGKSWKNMGLKDSRHISKIIVHPDNPEVIWVAAQGPLWNKGGERGLYKSTDAGQNWKKVLGDEEWVGVTDIVLDPRDPAWMYAATWQRHRNVAAHMGGGPGSGIHRSTDGGATWEKLTRGIPKSNLGKIGLAISPQQPDIVYAAIELDRTTGGVFRSTDRGSSWEKRSDAVSGATGPHYYQELYASPHQFDRLYLVNNRYLISEDGGKTFRSMRSRDMHSDSHAFAFRADDPDYLMVGTDGGLYESFDLGDTWRFFNNMPITQYYKVAVDDAEPFYNIFGGTQDNGSHGGPSRTDTEHGIRNADWFKTLGADGHQSATEPGNPNITYAETQQGGLHRIDRITGEQLFIQPQAGEGEDFERYNWDAPILVSPHSPSRLYFASQRVWRSDDRGDSWTAISGDLTKDQERLALPIMGRVQSWDAPWDVGAMSNYNTISSLAESPLQQGLIYAGTDDGLVQVTEDGGKNWRKIEVGSMPGVPSTAFVNDIKADLHDANTVYIAMDNHKYGDLNPYLLKSTDRGRSWTSIAANIPERTLVWRLVQDHVKPELLFAATEFGIYFTVDGGQQWVKLSGAPTIAFRDLAIQKRENDLIGASFGRSFYILDDYSVLRGVSSEQMAREATLFPTRKAWWYEPRSVVSSQGSSHYTADNPPYGAVFTYHLSEGIPTMKSKRQEKEKALAKAGKDIPFPGWEALEAERQQEKPRMLLTVRDDDGSVVRVIEGPAKKGFHRVAWDLSHPSKDPIRLQQRTAGFQNGSDGYRATPGNYTVSLSKLVDGKMTPLAGPVPFEVQPLRKGALEGRPLAEISSYRQTLEALDASIAAAYMVLDKSIQRIEAMQTAFSRTSVESGALYEQIYQAKKALMELDEQMNGNRSKEEIGERNPPNVRSRIRVASRGLSTTYGPTKLHRESLDMAKNQLAEIKTRLDQLSQEDIPGLEKALMEAGAPWIEGQALPKE